MYFGDDFFGFNKGTLTPNDLDAIELILPIHCEVLGGELQIKIDGGLTNFVFQIPKQTTIEHLASSFMTNGGFQTINFDPKILPK